MTQFQTLLMTIKDSWSIKEIEIDEIIKIYDEKSDNIFLVSELENNYNLNIYYAKNLYYIFEKLLNGWKIKDVRKLEKFLEDKLSNILNLSEFNISIFINLYLQVSTNNDNVIKLYDKFISEKYINVSSINYFCKYFLKNKLTDYFINSFLYNKEWWIRRVFYSYTWAYSDLQSWILKLKIADFNNFLEKLSETKNIEQFVEEITYSKNPKFIDNIISKAKKEQLYNSLYLLLIGQLKFSSSWKNYYNSTIFWDRNVNLFKYLKSKNLINYQKFYDDIKFWKERFYYFREFDTFIVNTLESENDVKDFLAINQFKDKEYLIRNIYFYIKDVTKDLILLKFFEKELWDKVNKYNFDREKALEEDKKYQAWIDEEIKTEIQKNLDNVLNKNVKYFVPQFLDDYVNKENYLRTFENSEIIIDVLVKEQIDRFFTFLNFNILDEKSLKSFEKTDTWFSSFWFMLDNSFNIVLKSAKKLWLNLSDYKLRIAWFYPFQDSLTDLDEIINYFDEECVKKIVYIYKKYEDIRKYQPINIIYLYEKLWILFKSKDVKNDLKEVIESLVISELVWKYIWFTRVFNVLKELWESFDYFKKLENKLKVNENYFTDILWKNDVDEKFNEYISLNDILIKFWEKEAFLWRLEQLENWFIKFKETEIETSWYARLVWNIESELVFSKEFIKILKEYGWIDLEIENKIIELIKISFVKYENEYYESFSTYVWQAIAYYLSWLDETLWYKISLINRISEILANENDVNKVTSFKRSISDIDDKFLLKIERDTEKVKLYNQLNEKSKLEEEIKKINGDNIVILTEWKTDWKHLIRSWYELEKKWILIEKWINEKIIEYIERYEDPNSIVWWNENMIWFIKKYSSIYNNKLVIWILDTDLNDWENQKKLKKIWEQSWRNSILKEYNNLYWLFLHTPDFRKNDNILKNEICIEFFYDDDILDIYKFIRKNKTKEVWDMWLVLEIPGNKFIHKNLFNNWKLIIDWNDSKLKIFDKNYQELKEPIKKEKIFTKDDFAEDIIFWFLKKEIWWRKNLFYNDPSEETWKRFLPIFKSLSEIINEWQGNENLNINENLKTIKEKNTILNKITLFLKSFFM